MASSSNSVLSAGSVARAVAPLGLNLVGVASVAAYDAQIASERRLARRLEGAESVIVVGNGGGAFWEAYRHACAADPALAARPDPLDDFTREVVEAACAPLTDAQATRIVFPFGFDAEVSFTRLAVLAGIGRPSLLGVLVHPVYGPWIALRAAILVRGRLAAPRPADGFDPCPTCRDRPCMSACPAGAIEAEGWSLSRCAGHRAPPDDPCAGRCHARVACVLGPEHRYPDDALAYHQRRARAPLLQASRS
jgi:epoxyqueuosine reductase QueG